MKNFNYSSQNSQHQSKSRALYMFQLECQKLDETQIVQNVSSIWHYLYDFKNNFYEFICRYWSLQQHKFLFQSLYVGRCSFDYLHSAFFVRHIFTYCCQTLLRFHVKYFISKSWRESSHNFKVGKTFNIFAKMRESCLCIIFAAERLRKCFDC